MLEREPGGPHPLGQLRTAVAAPAVHRDVVLAAERLERGFDEEQRTAGREHARSSRSARRSSSTENSTVSATTTSNDASGKGSAVSDARAGMISG